MSKFIFLICLICIGQDLSAQYASGKTIPDPSKEVIRDFDDWSYKLSSTITARDLREHVFTLASDEYEGRETGTEGNTKAAAYIADQFKQLGLPGVTSDGDYFQSVAFTFTSWEKLSLSLGGSKYKLLKDFIAFPQYSSSGAISGEEIMFLGYGIDDERYSDYHDVDVRDKIVLIFDGEPVGQDGKSLLTGDVGLSDWSEDWKLKSAAAYKNGAKMLLIISNDLQTLIGNNRRALVNRITQLGDHSDDHLSLTNTIFLSSKVAEEILGDKRDAVIAQRNALIQGEDKGDDIIISVPVGSHFDINRQVLEGQNVLGYIEGSDKKEEVVVVSAHYDHVGKKGDEVYNGADDNASGTTTVLEIAEALATAKRMGHGPKRSVLCLLVTGEEKGLLGSEYYANQPVYPLINTVADVNIDMVGRWGKEYPEGDNPYIYVIGSDRLSTDLHDINESVNQKYSHLLLDYKYNDEKDPNRFYYRSDHYNFAKNGIPSIFFFNGVHEDYHRLSDTPDKIDLDLMQQRARHIFHTVWELANRKERLQLSVDQTASP